ncbi:MarR family winged helix-turn-helix transcriptional regulator [Novosphingobium decolorationis]|uniref:MarR family transcriptional regulator n=1 Tax=Novosphingobium decolorationis TaxID=2698673 RepID=A0ABX8E3N0_9SPHN|nr:MarR family transcriptional regulator [Novosphingobium decolorationis]MED5545104.1 MarR family transcriptional regulator [Pseudomonadota bacterium]QVM83594.1 MarR family transcriptional regulator [Novosphingobium decolorationis]
MADTDQESLEDGADSGALEAMETSSPHAEILHRLLKLSNRLMTPFSVNLEHQYKISINEFRMLMLIGRYPHSASHELAERTGVNSMSVSRAVSALEKHGRVNVERDETNRRRKRLTLTEEGERLYTIMRPQTERVADYLLSDLKPHEVAMFDHILSTLITTLEATDAQGQSLFLERTRPTDEA